MRQSRRSIAGEIGFAAQTGQKEASAVGDIDRPPRRFLLAGKLGVAQIRGLVHSHLAKVGSRRSCFWVALASCHIVRLPGDPEVVTIRAISGVMWKPGQTASR
jgi:hypothetical protein